MSDTHSSYWCWCYTKTKHYWSGQCSLWRKGWLEQLERRLWCPPTPSDKCGRCCRARVTKPPAYHRPAPTMTECCLAWIPLWWLHLSLLVWQSGISTHHLMIVNPRHTESHNTGWCTHHRQWRQQVKAGKASPMIRSTLQGRVMPSLDYPCCSYGQ